jgi:hypothetical protein
MFARRPPHGTARACTLHRQVAVISSRKSASNIAPHFGAVCSNKNGRPLVARFGRQAFNGLRLAGSEAALPVWVGQSGPKQSEPTL